MLALLALAGPAAAAETAAGTPVDNRATISYAADGERHDGASNPVRLLVAERLDVALALVTAMRGTGNRTTLVRADLVNTGNGQEVFLLGVEAGDGAIIEVAVDSDRDGRLSDADQRLTDRTIAVAPGGSLALLVVVTFANEPPGDRAIILEARSITGSGTPGLAYDGQGDGGSDAVVGPTGARATVVAAVGVGAAPQLIKTQSVAVPGGGTVPVAGATITYSLEARFSGPTSAVRVDDDVPVGTRFVPGSITLDGRPLSDTVGDDAGSFDGTRVSVAIGDVSAPTTRSIQFQAIIP